MLKWTDFDFENRTVDITPEKGSDPRQLTISNQLIAMLNSLPQRPRATIRMHSDDTSQEPSDYKEPE